MKYVFVGNRRFVYEEMQAQNLDIVATFAIKNSHFERYAFASKIDFTAVQTKKEFLSKIENINFDILISNGCPFILPISKMKPRQYINIHPSLLPDLRGVDPVIGSILFKKSSGATCHLMNDEIDAGDIISQVEIPYTEDLDVSLLYQLSFFAEREVFRLALKKKFIPEFSQPNISGNTVYFTRSVEDQTLSFQESNDIWVQKIKSFSNRSQGAILHVSKTPYRFHLVQILDNPYIRKIATAYNEGVVLLNFENSIVFKKNGTVFLIKSLTEDISSLSPGTDLRE